MATSIVSTTWAANDTLAHFISWAQAIGTFLSSAGWSQAADSAQVNFGTITVPPTTSITSDTHAWNFRGAWSSVTAYAIGDTVTSGGSTWYAVAASTNITPVQGATWHLVCYEIWKSTDSVSSTTPIYVKFEYGGSGTLLILAVTFGTGSDGQGNLTGTVGTRQTAQVSSNTSAPQESDFSGSTGWFSLLLWRPLNSATVSYIAVDRSYDNLGNTTVNYFQTFFFAGGTGNLQIINNPSYGSALPLEAQFPSMLTKQTSGAVGANVLVSPVCPFYGRLDNQQLIALSCKQADMTEAATVQVNVYGSLHTYFCTKLATSVINAMVSTTPALMMRWE